MNGLAFDHTEDEEDTLGFNCMHQHEINSLPDTSVLIDTGSTVSVFKNKEALRNITKSATALRAHTNGVSRTQSYRVTYQVSLRYGTTHTAW